MIDEYGKPLEFCFFFFCIDDPPSAHPLVPRGLGTEEFPGGLAGAKLLFLITSETGASSLFVRVDAGFFFAASGEGLEAGGMHQALLCKLSSEVDVNGAPVAGWLAGSEANCVAGFVDALSNAVDPAEAECYFYRFGPGYARFSGTFFVEADELLAELVMMGFEPDAEVCGRGKECRSWWHGVQADVDGQGDPAMLEHSTHMAKRKES